MRQPVVTFADVLTSSGSFNTSSKKSDLPSVSSWSDFPSLRSHLFCQALQVLTVDQLKTKRERLRRLFACYKALQTSIGLGWNPDLSTVSSSKEYWADFVKHHSMANTVLEEGIQNYEMLKFIFDKNNATGIHAVGAEPNAVPMSFFDIDDDSLHDEMPGDGDGEADIVGGTSAFNEVCQRHIGGVSMRTSTHGIAKKQKKKKKATIDAEACGALKLIAESMSGRISGSRTSSTQGSPNHLLRCQELMDEMGIDSDLYTRALQLFIDKSAWSEMFSTMPQQRRLHVHMHVVLPAPPLPPTDPSN